MNARACALAWLAIPAGETVRVADDAALRAALREAKPGTTIAIAPGTYRGGIELRGLTGAEGRPIVIAGASREQPPLFEGGACAFHLRDVAWIELADFAVSGASGNGINVDDDGSAETPAHDVVLRRLAVRDIGGSGNQDGLKLSGVVRFRVEGGTIERWGAQGSGIDLVGCHDGVIEGVTLRQREGAGGSGVQVKGGSSRVTIRACRFEEAGSRAVNLGGSTGLQWFRPPLGRPPHAEARELLVERCTFLGSDAPIAFVGVDGAIVRSNTLYLPRRWALRILQETTQPGFVPCRNGRFERNLVVFRSDRWSEGGVNVGTGTDAASFAFADNWWWCADAPARSAPRLPRAEDGGVHGRDPELRDAAAGDLRPRPGSPAAGYGADAPEARR